MENTNLDELIVYDTNLAAIADLKEKYLSLTVKGIDDKEGYFVCKEARLEIKAVRVSIEKKRKELKEDSLTFGKKVDARARELSKPLEEIEAHLQAQQDIIDKEFERQKAAAEEAKRLRLKVRVDKLSEVRAYVDLILLSDMTDEEFEVRLKNATDDYNKKVDEEEKAKKRQAEVDAENQRLQEEKALKDAEIRRLNAEALAKANAENERLRKEADDKEKIRQAELKAIADKEAAKLEAERKVQAEKDAALAKEKADTEAAERKALEEKEKAEKAAKKKVADQKLFEHVKSTFPTIEAAWVEIARLMKLAGIEVK